jgi:hypothetical protein
MAEVLAVRRRVLGEEHPSTLLSMNNLAVAYRAGKRYDDAEGLFARTLEARRRLLGPEHPDTLTSASNLATLYVFQGKDAIAEPLLRQVLDVRRRVIGDNHPDTIGTLVWLGRIGLHLSDYAGAETRLRAALSAYEQAGTDTWERYACRSLLGASLTGQVKYGEAEPLLISGYEGLRQRKAAIPGERRVDLDEAGRRIVQFYERRGDAAKAAEWKRTLSAQ